MQREEEDMLKDPISYKREVLTVLNRIANNLENDQVGEAESDETPLDEKGYGPEEKPEPESSESEDF